MEPSASEIKIDIPRNEMERQLFFVCVWMLFHRIQREKKKMVKRKAPFNDYYCGKKTSDSRIRIASLWQVFPIKNSFEMQRSTSPCIKCFHVFLVERILRKMHFFSLYYAAIRYDILYGRRNSWALLHSTGFCMNNFSISASSRMQIHIINNYDIISITNRNEVNISFNLPWYRVRPGQCPHWSELENRMFQEPTNVGHPLMVVHVHRSCKYIKTKMINRNEMNYGSLEIAHKCIELN